MNSWRALPSGTRESYEREAAYTFTSRRLEAAQKMADALQHIKRRLQVDINDGGRPDQWSMEDLVRTIDKASEAWEQTK